MPTYAYACKDCGHAFDTVQSFSDSSLTTCPECSGTLRKKFSSVGVVFKGSGFYRTDSRSGSSASAPAAPASDTAAAASQPAASSTATSAPAKAADKAPAAAGAAN